MSRTIRDNNKKDGEIASNACKIKTDGEQIKHQKTESQDPAFYNPVFKKELKRISSKKVRKTAKENLVEKKENDAD